MFRHREYHLHLSGFHVDSSRNLRVLYGTRVSRDLVNKLTLFFFPIFLYNLGNTAPELLWLPLDRLQRGMLTIAGYYLLSQAAILCTAVLAGKLIHAIGHQRSFIFSYLLRIVVFSLLLFFPGSLWVVAGAAVIDGVQSNLFWNSYHTLLSQNTERDNMGKDLGLLQFFLQLVSVVSPALAGLAARYLGIEILFLFGILATLVSCVLAFFLNLQSVTDRVSFREFWSWIRERSFERLALSFAGRYMNDAALFVWPLYIFFMLGSIDKVGYLYTLSLFLALLLTFFIGATVDKLKTTKPLFASGGVLSLVWVARTQVGTPWGIALVDMVDKLTANFHWLYFDTLFLRRGKGSEALSYFVYREMIISSTGVLFWLVFGLLFLFGGGWNALFFLASGGVLLSVLIRDRHGTIR